MDVALLTVAEAARYLRLHPATLRRLARQGAVPAAKVGGTWRFRREDLAELASGAVREERGSSGGLRPENARLLKLLEEWVANPAPVDEEAWSQFERDLAENRFRVCDIEP